MNKLSNRIYVRLLEILMAALTVGFPVIWSHAQGRESSEHRQVTSNAGFKSLCIMSASSFAENAASGRAVPRFSRIAGKCSDVKKPIVLSITHENNKNNHVGAANYSPAIDSYIADFDSLTDLGKWIKIGFSLNTPPTISVALDTVNFDSINITGWPLRYGHLFAGVNDPSAYASIKSSLYLEFDIRIRADEVKEGLITGYSGRRVLLGATVEWSEKAPRTNRIHYAEVDLLQSSGYTESYDEPFRDGCVDIKYDRCFYDEVGKYSEGREVRFSKKVGESSNPFESGLWTHIKVPLSALISELHWRSPPDDWGAAQLVGVYLGIELKGAARIWVDFKNYELYAVN